MTGGPGTGINFSTRVDVDMIEKRSTHLRLEIRVTDQKSMKKKETVTTFTFVTRVISVEEKSKLTKKSDKLLLHLQRMKLSFLHSF